MSNEKHIEVVLQSCQNLIAMDKGGTSDPFVEFVLNKQKQKSAVIKKTLNPEWNATFIFAPEQGELVLNVFDKDTLGKDFEGKVVLETKKFLDNLCIPFHLTLPLMDKNDTKDKERGSITLRVTAVEPKGFAWLNAGQKVMEEDPELAMSLLTTALEKGKKEAHWELYKLYRDGHPQDEKKELEHLEKAAELDLGEPKGILFV
jgi:hypothetical protein